MAAKPSKSELKKMCKELKSIMRNFRGVPEYAEMTDEAAIRCTNCYAYAFGLTLFVEAHEYFGFLGWTIGKYENVKGVKLAESRLATDVSRMGLNLLKSEDASMPEKGFKIAFFLMDDGNFHFMRINKDGTWSEKNGYGGPVQKLEDDEGNALLPEQIRFPEATFVGYYVVA